MNTIRKAGELREKIARRSWLIQIGCEQVLSINIKDSVRW
jgi:hypothetical protein